MHIDTTGNTEQIKTGHLKNVEKYIETGVKTEALGPRKVGMFLMSGKLKQKNIEEDLEELQETEVNFQEQEYNELQCHMCSEMFTNVESLRHHMRKRYSHCVIVISRPVRSQGLLYKHLCHKLTN